MNLVLDEPTQNHLDLESIMALNTRAAGSTKAPSSLVYARQLRTSSKRLAHASGTFRGGGPTDFHITDHHQGP